MPETAAFLQADLSRDPTKDLDFAEREGAATDSAFLTFLAMVAALVREGTAYTEHGSAFQIFVAYSAMVRSLENFPEAATFRIALRAQASGSA
jgi:hypothetical protein